MARPEQPWSTFSPFEPGQEEDLTLRRTPKAVASCPSWSSSLDWLHPALGSISSTSTSPTHAQTKAEASSYPDLPYDQGQPQLRHLLEQTKAKKTSHEFQL